MSEREDRLPQWARQLITQLRQESADARSLAAALAGGDVDSNVIADPNMRALRLPHSSTVRFLLGDVDDPAASADVGFTTTGQLRIATRGGSLIVRPVVSNVVTVEIEPL